MKQFLFTILLLCASISFAQSTVKTEAPYLVIPTQNAHVPLLKSNATVDVVGTIAHVRLTQTYHNKGTTPIEAQYVFPMSLEAAVHDMTMTIGNRVVRAKIFEKQKAAQVYKDAVKEGKRAAKMDQSRPNVFQMKLGNIMPGDYISMDVYYTEMLLPTKGDYYLVVPSAVGPRFTGENTTGDTTFNQPYTKKGIADTFTYDIQASIQAGIIIQKVESTSHEIKVAYPTAQQALITLRDGVKNPANRDFILNYSLRGDAINTGLMLYEHNDEKFFAYLMEPPARPAHNHITAREYVFVVDVSGSMNGYPLEVSKQLMRNLLCNLNPEDTFNVQLFASSSTIYSPKPVKAIEENIEDAILFLSTGQGGGGTQLLKALQTAYALPRSNEGSARSMVIITDGYVSVEKEAFQLIENNLDKANVFTFGIGSSVNRYLIEGMSKVSQTASFIATSFEEANALAETFKTYIETPLLTQVSFKTKGFEVYDLASQTVPDVFANRPVLIFGKYKGDATGKIIIKGYQGRKKITHTYEVSTGTNSQNNKALRYLWARKKIATLNDYNNNFGEEVKAQVTQLGLQYNLMTKYTSFVAVDEVVANKKGTLKTVKQPLPMPLHVENSAVGAEAEVTGKSVFTSSFSAVVADVDLPLLKAIKLQLWFKNNFTSITTPLLETYDKIRVKFDQEGHVVSVEVFENGNWLQLDAATKIFQKATPENPATSHQFSIIASYKK